jgi:drug/metabolite transporter (DMT)-like permease
MYMRGSGKMLEPPPSLSSKGAWRSGYRLVVRGGATLPLACIKCGAPAAGPNIRKTFYWQPTGFFRFLPFPFSFIALLVGLLSRRKITVDIPICSIHRRRRKLGLLFTFGFCGVGLVLIGIALNWAIGNSYADADNAPVIIFTGIVLLLIGALCFVFAGRLLSPSQIDADQATFTGACAKFLQQLPDSPNPNL